MKNCVCAVLLVFGFLLSGATPALADTILYEATMVLKLRPENLDPTLTPTNRKSGTGVDALGLDGATLVFRAEFDTADTYINRFNLPSVDAVADSIAITGASIAATDGVYSSTTGVSLFPTLGGQYNSPAGDRVLWSVNGSTLNLRNFVTSVSGVAVGDNVAVSHFSTTLFAGLPRFDYGLFYVGSGSFLGTPRYDAMSFSATVTSVPEPSTLILLGIGGIAVVWRRRRRS